MRGLNLAHEFQYSLQGKKRALVLKNNTITQTRVYKFTTKFIAFHITDPKLSDQQKHHKSYTCQMPNSYNLIHYHTKIKIGKHRNNKNIEEQIHR